MAYSGIIDRQNAITGSALIALKDALGDNVAPIFAHNRLGQIEPDTRYNMTLVQNLVRELNASGMVSVACCAGDGTD